MRYWGWFAAKLTVAVAGTSALLKQISRAFPPETDKLAPLNHGMSFLLCDLALLLCFLLFAGTLYLSIRDQRDQFRTFVRRLSMPIATGSSSRILLLGRPQIEYICPFVRGTLREDDLHISGSSIAKWTPHP